MRVRTPLSWLAVAVASAVVVVVAAGCPAPVAPRPPVPLSLQIVTKPSCGVFSGLDYDTGCLSAVYVAVKDADSGQVLREACSALSERKPELGVLLRGDPVVEVPGVSATDTRVVFEVRGLHDKADVGADRCADADDDNHWLFWGESDVVHLAEFNVDDAVGQRVPVVVDCRDCAFSCEPGDCFGCAGLGATCPVALPESFCVPAVAFECDKRCDDDGDCFEGARRCEDGRCDVDEATGALCSPCALIDGAVDGCGEGFSCVGPPGSTQGFCAESCPGRFCPSGTKCNRVGNNLTVITGL